MQTVMQEVREQPTSSTPEIIQVRHVSKSFGKEAPVIRQLDFAVQKGQIFCLLGASGSGKSTTMRMLTGVYKPTQGDVRVFGEEPSQFRKRTRAAIGYMPQQFVLFPELTVNENINFMASVYGMKWFGRDKKVRQALEFVNLWEVRNRLASKLSGGMLRRLQLASTLVHQPQLLFVDEPTAGVDPVLRAKFWEHFETLRNEGRTLFVTTQYVTEADYCDVVAILNKGQLLALGAPNDIRKQALGGEAINVKLPDVNRANIEMLKGLPGMRRIQIMSGEDLRLTAEDATITLPDVIEACRNNNVEIRNIEVYHPNFEEVFVQLMEQADDNEADPEDDMPDKKPTQRPRERLAAISGQSSKKERN